MLNILSRQFYVVVMVLCVMAAFFTTRVLMHNYANGNSVLFAIDCVELAVQAVVFCLQVYFWRQKR